MAVLSLAPSLTAQEGKDPQAQPGGGEPGDIYINDSFEAADRLIKAADLTRKGRWSEAAELLQTASDTLGDRMVRTSEGIVGLRNHVSRLICAWPADAIRVYQSLYDPKLALELRRIEKSLQPEDFVPLFEKYFCTSGGAAMAERMALLAIERGDTPLARHVLGRVLNEHPQAAEYQSRYGAVLLIAQALEGTLDAEAVAQRGDDRLTWKGREASLAEVIQEIQAGIASRADEAKPPADWPVFGGNSERNAETMTNVDEPGLLWRVSLGRPKVNGKIEGVLEDLVPEDRAADRSLSIHPVVWGDLIFIQAYREILCVHRNSGAVAWRYGMAEPDAESDPYLSDRPVEWQSPAVDEHGRLFAALPADESAYYNYESTRAVPELVAFDALSGRELWRVSQKGDSVQGTATSFDSAPLAQNGRVYIVSRRRRSFGFEDCYLDGYLADDGRLLFRTHLGSASTSAYGLRGATKSIAALHDGVVYVGTNLGTVAAVSAYSGVVHWLRFYDRVRPDAAGVTAWPTREFLPWQVNPVLWHDDRLYVLPSDSSKLLVLSARDGSVIHSVALGELGSMQSLYGVRGELICGAGRAILCHDLASGKTRWSASLPPDREVYGRGQWAGEEILVPHKDGFSRLRVDDGRMEQEDWGASMEGGNLLVLPEAILVAGARDVACLVRKAEIWKNLRGRIAAAPDDPLPALEFAEVALGAGDLADSIEALESAAALVKPSLAAGPEAVRNRVFADVLKILEVARPTGVLDGEVVDRLFRYAAESAGSTAQHIDYRFKFAQRFAEAGRLDRAVRLYQQVLLDRTLREWPPLKSDEPAAKAKWTAAERIDELLERGGRAPYAEFEQQAQQWLEAARATRDEERLREIPEVYPNSLAAPQAMLAHAELLLRSDRPLGSAKLVARAYRRYRKSIDAVEAMRSIAQAYEQAGRPEHAYLWLTKAAREFPGATIVHEGRTLSLLAYRDRLGGARAKLEAPRPNLALPLKKSYEVSLVGAVVLLTPLFTDDPATSWKNFFVSNPDGVRGYRAADGKPLWTQPAAVRMKPELLTARDDLVVMATAFEVFALDVSTGTRRWSHGEYPVRWADPALDWEEGTGFRMHALRGNRLVSVREDGWMSCVDIQSGTVLWTVTRRPAPLGPLRLSDSWVVYHISREGTALLCVLDAASGELLHSIATDERRPIEDLYLTFDDHLVVVTSKSFTSYDMESQEKQWSVSLNWQIRRPTLLFELDAAYLIDDAAALRKLSLEDGRIAWELEGAIARGEQHETVEREGPYLIVSSVNMIRALDLVSGVLLWEATTPEEPRFMQRMVTRAYVAALHVPKDKPNAPSALYFYDHRNASGVIPRTGGVVDLGSLADVRGALAADGVILVQSGTDILGFTSP